MNNVYLNPFDIVESNYIDLDGNIKTYPDSNEPQKGLFLILCISHGNATCLKLTSQDKYCNGDVVVLKTSDHPFLMCDTFIQPNSYQTFRLQALNKVGSVHDKVRNVVSRSVYSFLNYIRESMDNNKINYVSPNCRRSYQQSVRNNRYTTGYNSSYSRYCR